jgi:GTP cyclohydrolase I
MEKKEELIQSNGNIVLSEKQRDEMKLKAEIAYGQFLDALRFDWKNDVQMKETPMRVAKMYVDELFRGCYTNIPDLKEFDNEGGYDGMVFSGGIDLFSTCAHHSVVFFGKAYIGYLPSPIGKVVGLSKLNRIVDFYSRRPEIQESLTMQIHSHLNKVLTGNFGVAVLLEAAHMCVRSRGVKQNSTMITSKLSGGFLDPDGASRKEFYDNIQYTKNQ